MIEEMHGSLVKDRKILVRLDRAHLEMMGKAPRAYTYLPPPHTMMSINQRPHLTHPPRR